MVIKEHCIEPELHWYAVYVRSRHEKAVFQALEAQRIHAYLPLVKKIRQWSDRRKEVELPLFRSYVFVRLDIRYEKLKVLQIEGVVKFAGIRKKVSVIPDKQINWIRILLKEPESVETEKRFPVGDKVVVVAGPMKGLEGVVQSIRGKTRLMVLFDSIMSCASVEINPEFLQRLKVKN